MHIYAPPCITKHATAWNCPDCKQRTRLLSYTYEWFGPDGTCIKCGRSFNEDGWVPLPFVRSSREKEIAKAKERFRRTKAIGVSAMMAALEATQ